MLYSDDFLINSDFIIIAEINNKLVAYMAICKLTEKELDRKYEIYQEEPVLENSLLIKHLVVSEKYRRQHIATKLFEFLKSYAINNKIDNLYLWTTLDNNIALDLYKKQGFYKMGDFYPADGTFNGLNGFHSIMLVCNARAIWDKNNIYLKKVDISEFKNVIYPEYEKIFPPIERKPYTEIEKAYNNNLTDLIEIIIEDQFVGFFIINHLNHNPYVVLDYFAILPEHQHKGYGSTAIKLLKEMYKEYDGIFVEIEKPENEEDVEENKIREKRVKFYERLDFHKMDFELELFTVKYLAYMLPCSKDMFCNEEVVKNIFEIYNAVSGEEKIKKNCSVIK